MEKILPAEIWMEVFLYLNVDDILVLCDTCQYWKNIIENLNLWKYHWYKLIKTAEKSYLRNETCLALRELDVVDVNLKSPCLRLRNIVLDKSHELQHCLLGANLKPFSYAVLKTHHSHLILSLFRENKPLRINVNYRYLKLSNDIPPKSDAYRSFRMPPMLTDNIDKLFGNTDAHRDHVHLELLVYCYPMGIVEHMPLLSKQFFEQCHVQEVVYVPRVVMLCLNLDLPMAIVVYSTSRTTEVAVVLNGCIDDDRWSEIPVGGWNVAENLHATFQWLHPMNTDVAKFEEPNIKSVCWLRTSANCDKQDVVVHLSTDDDDQDSKKMFVLKKEQYLAAEVMYAQLDLCSVIQKLLHDLPDDVISNCLSHVILAGGNCKLKHLNIRLKLDLMKTFPQHSNVITTSLHVGLVYSSSVEEFSMESTNKFEPGKISRMKREHYIIGDI